MSGKQRAVLWLGIIMIGLNLVSKWSEIKDVIFTSPASSGSSGSSGGSSSGGTFGIASLPFPLNLVNETTKGATNNTPATNTVTAV